MFGFGKRKQYNADVKAHIEQAYGVDTGHPTFPGVLVFLEYIDGGWANQLTAEECAATIAVGYMNGLLRAGHDEAASTLATNLGRASQADFGAGKMNMQCGGMVIAAIQVAQATVEARRTPPEQPKESQAAAEQTWDWDYQTESGFYPERARQFMEAKKRSS